MCDRAVQFSQAWKMYRSCGCLCHTSVMLHADGLREVQSMADGIVSNLDAADVEGMMDEGVEMAER
jgi:hypothetical protein